jgi:hypothetical protein
MRMTPSEFLYHLKKLPADTPMTATHVAAILETLTPLLKHQPQTDFDSLPNSKLIDEDALAEWLDESPSSLQKWRLKGDGPKFVKGPKSVRYAVGAVRDWIASRTVISTTEAQVKGLSKLENLFGAHRDETTWSPPSPVMVVEGRFVGFFRSLEQDLESEPDAFHMIRFPISAAAEPPLAASLHDGFHGFSSDIATHREQAKNTYGEWANRLTDGQRLHWLEAALPFDLDFAKHIGNRLSMGFAAKHFQPAAWLWQVLVEYGDTLLCRDNLLYAFDYLASMDVDLNRASHIEDRNGHEMFTGTIAHLLADTMGEVFHADGLPEDLQYYGPLLTTLLDLGMDINQPDKTSNGRTASDIANAIDQQHGQGSSLFNVALNRYRLQEKMQTHLPVKNESAQSKLHNDGKL